MIVTEISRFKKHLIKKRGFEPESGTLNVVKYDV